MPGYRKRRANTILGRPRSMPAGAFFWTGVAMDIRIEAVTGDPPTWKVFLGTVFWSCETLAEAVEWATKAASYIHGASSTGYKLPAPPLAVVKSGERGEFPATTMEKHARYRGAIVVHQGCLEVQPPPREILFKALSDCRY